MSPNESLAFAVGLRGSLPPGWGWLTWEGYDGRLHLVIEESRPPLPPGWLIWLARDLLGGGMLRGAVTFGPDDSPQDVEARVWVVLAHLRAQEARLAARWN